MKIKEIIESFSHIKNKAQLAYKIDKCEPEIKEAIKQLVSDGILSDISVKIKNPVSEKITEISSFDLVNFYGFAKLNALLFLDNLEKVRKQKDYTTMLRMLHPIVHGNCNLDIKLDKDFVKDILENSPELCAEYQKIEEQECAKQAELEKDYPQISEEDI